MQVGFASIDITPDRLIHLQGQMHARLAERTRDPLMASALALVDGDTQVVLVSCDICMIPDEVAAEMRAAFAPAHVVVCATHTHVGPCMVAFRETQVIDEQYYAEFRAKVKEVIAAALDDLEPATLSASGGWIEHMGWNRRGLHRDGTVDMYFGSWCGEDFAGVEGPRDGDVPVIAARREDGSLKAVLTGFASHPNCCENELFYSADIPGAVRDTLHKSLGNDVGVVYLTGAAGNTAPTIMENNPEPRHPWRKEDGLVRSGQYLGAEILKQLAAQIDPMANQSLAVMSETLPIALRPWPDDFVPETRVRPGPGQDYYLDNHAKWDTILAEGPCDVRVSVIRIGDVALCTNPSELYVEHGIAIKKDSPAALTMIAQLADGYCGYVPTVDAFKRGGYSTWNAPTSKLAQDAGDQIVEVTKGMLSKMFSDPK